MSYELRVCQNELVEAEKEIERLRAALEEIAEPSYRGADSGCLNELLDEIEDIAKRALNATEQGRSVN